MTTGNRVALRRIAGREHDLVMYEIPAVAMILSGRMRKMNTFYMAQPDTTYGIPAPYFVSDLLLLGVLCKTALGPEFYLWPEPRSCKNTSLHRPSPF